MGDLLTKWGYDFANDAFVGVIKLGRTLVGFRGDDAGLFLCTGCASPSSDIRRRLLADAGIIELQSPKWGIPGYLMLMTG